MRFPLSMLDGNWCGCYACVFGKHVVEIVWEPLPLHIKDTILQQMPLFLALLTSSSDMSSEPWV